MSACDHPWYYYTIHPVEAGKCLGTKLDAQWAAFVAWVERRLDAIKGWFLGVPADTPCLKDVSLWECFVWAVRARLLRYAAASERVGGTFVLIGGAALAAYSGYSIYRDKIGWWNGSGVVLGGGLGALGYWMRTQAHAHSVLPRPCRPTASVYEAIFQMPLDANTQCMLASAAPAHSGVDLLASRATSLCPIAAQMQTTQMLAIGCEPWTATSPARTLALTLTYGIFDTTCKNTLTFAIQLVYDADAQQISMSTALDGSSGVVQQPWAADLPPPPPAGATCCFFVAQQTLQGVSLWFNAVPVQGDWPHVFVPALDALLHAGDTVAWDTGADYGNGALRVAFAPCAMAVQKTWVETNPLKNVVYGDFAAVATAQGAGANLGVPVQLPQPSDKVDVGMYLYAAFYPSAPGPNAVDPRIRATLPTWDSQLYVGGAMPGDTPCPMLCGSTPSPCAYTYPALTPTSAYSAAAATPKFSPQQGILATLINIDGPPPNGILELPSVQANSPANQVVYTAQFAFGAMQNAMTLTGTLNDFLKPDAWSGAGTMWVPLPPPWRNPYGGMDVVPYGSAQYPPWLPLPVVTLVVQPGPQNAGSWPKTPVGPGGWNVDGFSWGISMWVTWTPPTGGTLPTGVPGLTISKTTTASWVPGGPAGLLATQWDTGARSANSKGQWPLQLTLGDSQTQTYGLYGAGSLALTWAKGGTGISSGGEGNAVPKGVFGNISTLLGFAAGPAGVFSVGDPGNTVPIGSEPATAVATIVFLTAPRSEVDN